MFIVGLSLTAFSVSNQSYSSNLLHVVVTSQCEKFGEAGLELVRRPTWSWSLSTPTNLRWSYKFGETGPGRGLKTRIAEHRRDVRGHVLSNAIVVHVEKSGHLPRWEEAEILEKGIKKDIRRALEAAHIMTKRTYNTRAGFYTLGQATAELALQRRSGIT